MNKHLHKIPEAFFIVADFGKLGRETVIDWENCSRADVLALLKSGEYDRPLSVQHLIPDEGTLRDVSEDFAQAIIDGVSDGDDLPVGGLFDFCEQHLSCQTMAEVAREAAWWVATSASAHRPREQSSLANARLIAAAPDMLADHIENARLLSLVIHDLQGRVEGGKIAALSLCLDRSRAAIAKATGETK